ncbi:uncharacterized protein LOC110923737 [Helianthus annuus]|uniref:uncharacterized protein LOC110923737 n=1 Tax=Helianthus annuus TaxID=4232 RepID=UPI000B8FB908|nr:uncharacterized protein LOC110923737 [Helianthus annuus]
MGVWNWSRSPSSAEELLEWHELIGLLDNVTFSDGKDGWEWLGGNDSGFSVKTVKNFLYSDSDFSSRHVVKWSKWVPKNEIFFVWRAVLDRIPTLTALRDRNCWGRYVKCCLCEDGDETAEHLLCSCRVASTVCYHISQWCKVSPCILFSAKDIVIASEFCNLDREVKEDLHGIMFVTSWFIWLARNNKRFSETQVKPERLSVILSPSVYGIRIRLKIVLGSAASVLEEKIIRNCSWIDNKDVFD